jgi:hypothetical protein
MWCGDQHRRTPLRSRSRHRQGAGQVAGPVIDPGQNMAMDVNQTVDSAPII